MFTVMCQAETRKMPSDETFVDSTHGNITCRIYSDRNHQVQPVAGELNVGGSTHLGGTSV